jgi:hypothetical protein
MDSTPTEAVVPSPVQTPTPFQRTFRSIFTRHALYLALLVVLPVALAEGLNASLTLLRDPDIWWHLADARLLFTTGHFIQSEPYSFTVAGQPWINPEWLAEIPYWLSYQAFGLCGIYLVTGLVICANILLVYWRGYLNARNADSAFWAAGLGFVLMAVNVGPRMIALGYAALSLELLILEAAERGHRRWLWFLPAVFCLWVNMHGSWVIGMAILVLYLVAGSMRVHSGALAQDSLSPADRKHLLAVLAASLVALFINPYGWRLVWNPLDMMMNQKLNIASVAEWQPLKVGSFEGASLVLVLLLLVLANLKRGRTWKLYDLGIVFFGFYAAVDHVRFLYLAAVLIAPILAMDLARSFSQEPDAKTIPAMNALIAAAALVYVAIMFPSEAKLQKKLELEFPLQTIRSIQPGWRTFNWDYVGGRMAFDSRSSFLDSRLDTFEHHGVFQDYMAAMNLVDPLAVLNRYKVDHVLVLDLQPIAYLLKHTPGWQLVRSEKVGQQTFVVFARNPRSTSGSP